MYDTIRLVLIKNGLNLRLIRNIYFLKKVIGFALYFLQIFKVSRISKIVNIDDLVITNFKPFEGNTLATAKNIAFTMSVKERGGKSRMAMCMSGDIPFQQHKQNVEHHLTFLTQKRNPRKKPCIFHFALTKFFFPVFFFGSSRGGSEGWSMTTGVRSSSAQKKKEGFSSRHRPAVTLGHNFCTASSCSLLSLSHAYHMQHV